MTRVRLTSVAERVSKMEQNLKLTNLFNDRLAEDSAGTGTASNGVGDELARRMELPTVLARQTSSSQERQNILESENISRVITAVPAASAENITPSQGLATTQLLGKYNLTGQ